MLDHATSSIFVTDIDQQSHNIVASYNQVDGDIDASIYPRAPLFC